ncbi:hypothetical protein [Streptomyces sp. H39-S7]|uniref:hypothetical protein n=1 Tax=Streptomyces sp. H39-S7 TaxID=3004357 RepID=UPI0022B055AA|nr:hypothetical protein [Streptomyces sp. H39-S7]MCZ4120259.1 hypothetical protein [Streptomyces sp. H39-S7]
MSERVLVAYGTKNNSTAGIAEMIGEALRGEGLRADVLPASTVADIGQYGPVILGCRLPAQLPHQYIVDLGCGKSFGRAQRACELG